MNIDKNNADEAVKNLIALEDSISHLNLKIENLRQQYNVLERKLYYWLKENHDKHISPHGCAEIIKTPVCSINDAKELLEFVVRENHPSLMSRDVNNKEYRKLLAKGIKIPGTSTYKKLGVKITRK